MSELAVGEHIRLADAPIAADQMGFEELDGLLYYAGGRSATAHSAKCYAYNPADNTWTEKADLPIATGVQSGVLKAVSGKLYYIGGHDSDLNVFYKKVYEYDPASNQWTTKTDMPTGREDFGAAVIGSKIYCFGGLKNAYVETKVLEIYDTVANTWSTGADMPDFKHFGDFGVAYNGKIYAIGSSNTFADYDTLHPELTVWEYDPTLNTWTAKADMPGGACYKECVVLNGKIFCVSGVTTHVTRYSKETYSYDPGTNTWTTELPAPYAARGTGLAVYNGAIYMVGGYRGAMSSYLFRLGYE